MAKELKKLTKDLFHQLAIRAHETSEKYWFDKATGLPKERSIESLLTLVISELIESVEALRNEKENPDFVLMPRDCNSTEQWQLIKDNAFPELAGCLLRLFDMLGASYKGRLMLGGKNADGLQKHIIGELLELESKRMPKRKIKGANEYEIRQSVMNFYFELITDITKATNEPKKLVRVVFKIWQYCIDENCDIFNLITYADLANKNRPAKIA